MPLGDLDTIGRDIKPIAPQMVTLSIDAGRKTKVRAGDILGALGVEHRSEEASYSPDLMVRNGQIAGTTGQPKGVLVTPNGYTLTVSAALGIVAKLMAAQRPIGGYYTPSRLMGADYVLRLPGVKRLPER